MTKVAFVFVAIESGGGIPIGFALKAVVFQKPLRDYTARVTLSKLAVDGLTIEVSGVRARGSFEVVRQTRSGDETSRTERTVDLSAAVSPRIHVLTEIVGTWEIAATIGAVEMLVVALILLVLVAIVSCGEGERTSFAMIVVSVVVLVSHVLLRLSVSTEASRASHTLMLPYPMVYSRHVLLASMPGGKAP